MDTGLWQTVQDVFIAASERPADEQSAFLADVCAGRPEVRAEVESLLRAHARAGAGAFIEPSMPHHVPVRVGPYRLIEEIGHGGMGIVYRAERDDGQYEQQVAVKLLSVPGSALLSQKFLEERQILANLSHPHIARLLDGGVTRTGVSYIVMEHVDGVPIDRYGQGRSIADRLRLFRQICAAVHDAHQHLVVHRDLKPANILVTADGTPKLLDFGIAKMLAPDASASADGEGRTLLPAMTPDYASPEQVRGRAISTASDIYSLGVLLYVILTGRRPYDLTSKSYDEMLAIVCDQAIAPPATGSADLDAIVAKAMRKEPSERYASAEALSADVDRYLAKRPVEARRGAVWYVFSRFLARHRVGVATACVVALLLAGAVAAIVYQSRVAARRFDDVRTLAHAVVFEIHDEVAKLPGSTAARKLLVARALRYLDELSRDAGNDDPLQVELAEGYLRLGDVQGYHPQANLGDPQGAIVSYRKAHALFTTVLPRRPQDARVVLGLTRVKNHLGEELNLLGQTHEAQHLATESVSLLDALVRREPTDTHRVALASAYGQMADVFDDRVTWWPKALTIFEALLAARPDDPERQRNTALAHKYIAGGLLHEEGRDDEVLRHLQAAEALDAARAAAHPNARDAQLDLSFDYSQNATFYLNRKQYPEALANFQRVVDIRRRLVDADPSDVRLRDRLAFASSMVGLVLHHMKRPTEARVAQQEALRLAQALLDRDPKHPLFRAAVARAQFRLGEVESTLGRRREACAAWKVSRTLYEAITRDKQTDVTMPTDRLSDVRERLSTCAP